jgi:hypothetical protein
VFLSWFRQKPADTYPNLGGAPVASVPGLLLLGAPKHLQGFDMHIIAMNMFDIAAKLVVVAFVCAFVCYWLLR